jgi:hypothetical protein
MSGGHVPGGDAVLLIRPTALALCGTHDGDNHLAGTVADVAFRGRGYEHAVDIPGHGRLTGIFAPVRSERGETVGHRLDPVGCYVFAGTDAAGGQEATDAAQLDRETSHLGLLAKLPGPPPIR